MLNLIEAATGGRFHPNFNRIGGLKDDFPWGFTAECRQVMRRVFESCDTFEDLVLGNPIFEQRTRSIGIIPPELGAAYGVSGSGLRMPAGSRGSVSSTPRSIAISRRSSQSSAR